jgi:acyl carrier protein
MEAIAGLQEEMGIELDKEAGQRIAHIGELIDEFYERVIEIYPEPRKGKEKGA